MATQVPADDLKSQKLYSLKSRATNVISTLIQMGVLAVVTYGALEYIPSIPLDTDTKLLITITVSVIYFLSGLLYYTLSSVGNSLCVIAC